MATKFKGKYPGPDALKGDKAKRAAYRKALKGGASKSKALATARRYKATPAKVTPAKPATPASPSVPKPDTTPSQPTVYQPPTSNVATNASGTVELQTNADIEDAILQAEEENRQAETEATQTEQQAVIDRLNNNEQLRLSSNNARGQVNAASAYRGMRGSSAQRRRDEVESDITTSKNTIEQNFNLANTYARNRRLAGTEGVRRAKAWANQKRLEFTNAQSRNNPTEGSVPENAGVTPTAPPAAAPKPAAPKPAAPKPAAPKPAAKPSKKTPAKKKKKKKKPALKSPAKKAAAKKAAVRRSKNRKSKKR